MSIKPSIEYQQFKRKIVFDALEKFPDTPSKTLARMLYNDNPLLFADIEEARSFIRSYRGVAGKYKRRYTKVTKYYKDAV